MNNNKHVIIGNLVHNMIDQVLSAIDDMQEPSIPHTYESSYIQAILEGREDTPSGLTEYGERMLLVECFDLVGRVLINHPNVAYIGVINFLGLLSDVYPANVGLAKQMHSQVLQHPTFIRMYMPLYNQHMKNKQKESSDMDMPFGPKVMVVKMHPQDYPGGLMDFLQQLEMVSATNEDGSQPTKSAGPKKDSFDGKITDEYLDELVQRKAQIPDLDEQQMDKYMNMVSSYIVERILRDPSFSNVVLEYMMSIAHDNKNETALAQHIAKKFLSPKFLLAAINNPAFIKYLEKFIN